MARKSLVVLLLSCAIASGILYAGGQGEKPTGGKQVVTLWGLPDEWFIKHEKYITTLLYKKYPNVEIVRSSAADAEYKTKVTTALATHTGPDLLGVPSPAFQQWKQYFSPVDLKVFGRTSYEEFANDWLPGSLDVYSWEGKAYAVPREQGCQAIYLNTAIFADAGLDWKKDAPKTWEEMTAVGKKLTRYDASGNITRQAYAFYFPGVPEANMLIFNAMVLQLGGDMVKDFSGPAVVKVLSDLNDWVNVSRISDPAAEIGGARIAYVQGTAAMNSMMGAWGSAWLANEYPNIGKVSAVIPLPRYANGKDIASMAYGWAYAVPQDSKVKEIAWEYIKDYVEHPWEALNDLSVVIPIKGWYDPNTNKEPAPYFNLWWSEMAKSRWAEPELGVHAVEIQQVALRAIEEVVLSKMPPQDAANKGAAEIKRILGK